MRPRSAYVHVPFCRHRCGYCDFPLVAGRDDLQEGYFAALAVELGRVAEPLPLDTLFLGGGTPSHLGPDGLRRLFGLLEPHLQFEGATEVSLEANPLDLTQGFVEAAVACGVTRVSLGAQSLETSTLRVLERDHDANDVRDAVGRLRDAGLTVSLDLMIAAPDQSLADMIADLEGMVALTSEHLSVYCLTWEEGTAFASRRRKGQLNGVAEELEREMYLEAIERLEAAGYEHYEVSNFAQPGFRCRHNEAYWLCQPWEAFGPGAARFDGRTRRTNHRSTTTWMRRLLSGGDPTAETDAMDDEQAARERLVLGLRRREGIDSEAFAAASGFSPRQLAGRSIDRWITAGLACEAGGRVWLSREGLLLSDGLWSEVLGDGT
jgi:oxygen-independent coproporphyrinogen-3 oxidase